MTSVLCYSTLLNTHEYQRVCLLETSCPSRTTLAGASGREQQANSQCALEKHHSHK